MAAISHVKPWPQTYIPYLTSVALNPITTTPTASAFGPQQLLLLLASHPDSSRYLVTGDLTPKKDIFIFLTIILEVPATMATCHQSLVTSQNYSTFDPWI